MNTCRKISRKKIAKFQQGILSWYKAGGRKLPWRQTKNRYYLLIAEILLQKTDVAKVKNIYDDFIERWPTLQDLSEAKTSSIKKMITPLGLTYKANRLKNTAKVIIDDFNGYVPSSKKLLLSLPGIGRYIANAIACFAFNKSIAVLDTNVIRILGRVFKVKSNKNRPRDDNDLWDFAQSLMPSKHVKAYNWGLLDLGAVICRHDKPICGLCIIRDICEFYSNRKVVLQKSKKECKRLKAVDLFAGTGGLSLGFEEAGFDVQFAVEDDYYSALTYQMNRMKNHTVVLWSDIRNLDFRVLLKKRKIKKGQIDILLCGPPCQGYSQSNMRTRDDRNPQNSLYFEFLRAVRDIQPMWVVFENVPGIVTFQKGKVVKELVENVEAIGYSCCYKIINAVDYGVPQFRRRFFLVGTRMSTNFLFPTPTFGVSGKTYVTVRDAISDLPSLRNGNRLDTMEYATNGAKLSRYQKVARKNWNADYVLNNCVTKNSNMIVKRYKYIEPGYNWKDIPKRLLTNYKNTLNCHSGIYRRLKWEQPAIIISNFRKNMLIHPEHDRGISVREAARLQSFPDNYHFFGPLSYQQQQVADAVPPLLAQILAESIKKGMLL
jgi:DNA (cytosine-5)-methyltransferase 1